VGDLEADELAAASGAGGDECLLALDGDGVRDQAATGPQRVPAAVDQPTGRQPAADEDRVHEQRTGALDSILRQCLADRW